MKPLYLLNSFSPAVFLVCALSAAGAMFLIFEMDDPFSGVIKVSSAPFEQTLVRLGK